MKKKYCKYMCYFVLQTEVDGSNKPLPVRALTKHRVVDISMGQYHSAVIIEPGHIYMFGRNAEGQLGIGNTKPNCAPVEVKFLLENSVNVSILHLGHHTWDID